ncbi:MAG: hypothetical protein IPQ07_22545 [Myxococcales bacterium]|nr:hypothetical protein [Myxococcales bacterium]
MWKFLVVGALLASSCLRDTSFKCSTNAECGQGGTCERGVGYCSVTDTGCASGSRFGSSAGPYAGQCVGEDAPADAPVADAPIVDAPITGCPSNFMAITGGQGTHVYRAIPMTSSWQQQRSRCSGLSSAAYLAIPDDLAELQAISSLAAGEVWVGISDTATENTFLTVKGVPATFLPWDTNQPDDQGPGEDCVIIHEQNSKLRDERCNDGFRAVCECEP